MAGSAYTRTPWHCTTRSALQPPPRPELVCLIGRLPRVSGVRQRLPGGLQVTWIFGPLLPGPTPPTAVTVHVCGAAIPKGHGGVASPWESSTREHGGVKGGGAPGL